MSEFANRRLERGKMGREVCLVMIIDESTRV
jgi:hypothetical protein